MLYFRNLDCNFFLCILPLIISDDDIGDDDEVSCSLLTISSQSCISQKKEQPNFDMPFIFKLHINNFT